MLVYLVVQLCSALQPHGLQPTRLFCPWNFPGKNSRVGCHFLLWGIFLTQVGPQVSCDSFVAGRFFITAYAGSLLDYIYMCKSLSHVLLFVTPGTIQSMEFSRPEYWNGQPFPSPGHLHNPGIEPRSSALQADFLPAEIPGMPKNTEVGSLALLQ